MRQSPKRTAQLLSLLQLQRVLSEFFQWTEPSHALIKWARPRAHFCWTEYGRRDHVATTLRKKSVTLGVSEHICNPSCERLKREDGNFKAKLGYK